MLNFNTSLNDELNLTVSLPKRLLLFGVISTLLGCEDPSELIPLNNLPFEYQLKLKLKSTSCTLADGTLPPLQTLGQLNLGRQDQLVVAIIKTEKFNWRLEGLRCIDDQKNSQSLCLASKQSQQLQSIMRSPGIRDENDSLLTCSLWNFIPETASSVSDSFIRPNDPEWQQALNECCQSNQGNQHAVFLQINESSTIEGELSIKHELSVELPINGQLITLSRDEYQGALTACGGPINCVDRFYLQAQPAQ